MAIYKIFVVCIMQINTLKTCACNALPTIKTIVIIEVFLVQFSFSRAGFCGHGGIWDTSGDLRERWNVQHGRTLRRKEHEQAQVRVGVSAYGILRRFQPQER